MKVRAWVADGLLAGAVAWPLSALPSALQEVASGRSWAGSHRAAGNLLLDAGAPPERLLAVGALTRAAVALNWGVVMSRWLDRRHPVAHGAGAGLALFAFQYVGVGRRRPLVRALPAGAQLADHLVYGVAVGAVLARRRRCRGAAVG